MRSFCCLRHQSRNFATSMPLPFRFWRAGGVPTTVVEHLAQVLRHDGGDLRKHVERRRRELRVGVGDHPLRAQHDGSAENLNDFEQPLGASHGEGLLHGRENRAVTTLPSRKNGAFTAPYISSRGMLGLIATLTTVAIKYPTPTTTAKTIALPTDVTPTACIRMPLEMVNGDDGTADDDDEVRWTPSFGPFSGPRPLHPGTALLS